jgi:hypothetical protein
MGTDRPFELDLNPWHSLCVFTVLAVRTRALAEGSDYAENGELLRDRSELAGERSFMDDNPGS